MQKEIQPRKNIFVTGAAGFIGSNLADKLLAKGHRVTGWDNFSTGQDQFLNEAKKNPNFQIIRGDCLDVKSLTAAMEGMEIVFHLSANADVRYGIHHPEKDLQQNTIATFNVLEAMRKNRVPVIGFSSTGSIYGDVPIVPTPESAPFPVQTSLYGASKLAGEGLIQAYCEGFGMEGYIFRFVSILGERYTHGHVYDFYQQLLEHPSYLKVLGNGQQKKSYLYIEDCIDAILHVIGQGTSQNSKNRVQIYNLGTTEYCQVNDSIGWICEKLNLKPKIEFTGGDRGWIGDNPFIFLDTTKIQSTGWHAKLSIRQGIERTLSWLSKNHWVFEARKQVKLHENHTHPSI